MAAITWTNVTDVAPELSTLPVGFQAAILAHVNGSGCNVAVFDGEDGETTALARAYLAAHLATVGKPGSGGSGVAGPIASHSVGGMSRSYVAQLIGRQDVRSTGYGNMFFLLAEAGAGGAWIA